VHSLQRGPDVLGFDTRLWTAQAVADLVTHGFRVKSPRAGFTNRGSAGVDLVAAGGVWSQKEAQTEWPAAIFIDEN
jgi:hypothetical protein